MVINMAINLLHMYLTIFSPIQNGGKKPPFHYLSFTIFKINFT